MTGADIKLAYLSFYRDNECMRNIIDMHVHSCFSDGDKSPEKIGEMSRKRKLEIISFADHNTIKGFLYYNNHAKRSDLTVFPGVEIGIMNEPARHLIDIHMLGYFFDCKDKKLNGIFYEMEKSRLDWCDEQVKVLNENGIEVNAKEVKKLATPAVPQRPHIWKAIKNSNGISREEFFERTGGNGDLYVMKNFELSLEDSIKLIHGAGGVAVLAHPGYYDTDRVVDLCVNAGIDGLEVKYHYNGNINRSKRIVRHVNGLADRFGLLKTGGSDYHNGNGTGLGGVFVPRMYFETMKDYIRNKKI